jgi:putative transposase
MNTYDVFIKQVISEMTNSHKFKIENMESDQDHIHLLISARPDISPSQISKVIKQKTSYALWQNYEIDLRKQFWKKNTFWTRSYFINSIGSVDKEVIKNYINNQGK